MFLLSWKFGAHLKRYKGRKRAIWSLLSDVLNAAFLSLVHGRRQVQRRHLGLKLAPCFPVSWAEKESLRTSTLSPPRGQRGFAWCSDILQSLGCLLRIEWPFLSRQTMWGVARTWQSSSNSKRRWLATKAGWDLPHSIENFQFSSLKKHSYCVSEKVTKYTCNIHLQQVNLAFSCKLTL